MRRPSFLFLLAALFLLTGCLPLAQSLVRSLVTITGVETSGPTSPVVAGELATPICPAIPRPSLLLALPDDAYALFDPASGASCPLPFADALPRLVAMVGEDFFVAERTTGAEGEASIIRRYRQDGTFAELPYTRVERTAGAELVAFTVSPDLRLIAWSVLTTTAGSDFPAPGLAIADLATGQRLGGVAPETNAPLALLPIRFSEDGSLLTYALQPYGLGGIWSSYVGRYANLYTVATTGDSVGEAVFDCATAGLGLCLGDFFLVENRVATLAYVDRGAGALVIQNGDGKVLNTLQSQAAYIGYPTWGPGGELVYYSAELAADPNASAAPSLGALQRVAPPTAAAETLVSDPALLLPISFFNDQQLVVGWAGAAGERGLGLARQEGGVQVLTGPPGGKRVTLPAVSLLLGVGGGVVSVP